MATQNLKRKKNNNLKDQKGTRASKDPAIIRPLSAKQTGKWAEETLHKVHEELEIRVQERTTELMSVVEALQDKMAERKRAEGALRKSEETAKRLAQENAVIAEIGRIISSTLNIKEVYDRFAEEVKKLIPFDRIAIRTINPKDNTTTTAYILGVDVPGHQLGSTVPLFGTVIERCIRTQSSLLFQPESMDEVVNRFPHLLPTFKAGLRSMMFVPLISKDQVIGVLSLQATKPKAHTEGDLRLAERVGHQIAGAIVNAQLFVERKQGKEKYRTILRTAMDGFWIVDMQGRFLDVNDAYCRLIGYSRDELLTMRISDIEAVERSEETARRIQKIMEVSGDRFETHHKCKDGRIIDIEVSVNYIDVGSRQMIVFLRDITER
ncbi:MAG: PAS domain S-box protein, partial [Dehalococcoidia bacterium]|nr:PAS domain S-box protein [Dehalococcoidia bacterium]